MPTDDNQSQLVKSGQEVAPDVQQLVTVESQREFDLFSGKRSERTFLKLYVEARTSGLLAAISDRDWKTLCALATYMDGDGYCFPSQVELARALGCSRQMANERIKSLATFRFQGKPVVLVEKDGRTEQGTWSRNGYRILPIANLGIFDDVQSEPTDRRKQTRPKWSTSPEPKPNPTVSRTLDTDTMSRHVDTVEGVADATVSSATVPVRLDTNKNQRTNKNQICPSNIRKVTTAKGSQREPSSEASEPIHQVHDAPGDVGEILARRAVSRQPVPVEIDPARDTILEYLTDFRREFPDRASLKSSTTRAYNLYLESGVTLDTFIDGLYRARSIVKERTGSIRGAEVDEQGRATKSKMAYFFAVLEDLLGLRETPDSLHQ